ncbi:hypothetical protein FRC12_008654, partial [Ceratobasidium sp. 428]
PRRQKQARTRLETLRAARAERLSEDRQAAVDYIGSVKEQVDRKIEAERGVDGLIILEARYGSSKQIDLAHGDRTIDVAVPLQLLVSGSQLSIPGGRSKAGLLGFYDPCPGERKSLRVKYVFRGRGHGVTVEDRAGVSMPLRGAFWFGFSFGPDGG